MLKLLQQLLMLHAAVQHIPPQISMAAAREEAEMVLFDSVRQVLEEARLKPGQVCSKSQAAHAPGLGVVLVFCAVWVMRCHQLFCSCSICTTKMAH